MTLRLLPMVTLALSQFLAGCSVLGLVYGLREMEPEWEGSYSGAELAGGQGPGDLDLVVRLADGAATRGEWHGLRSLTVGQVDSMVRLLPHPTSLPHRGDSVWLVFRNSATHLRWEGIDRYQVLAGDLRGGHDRSAGLDSVVKFLREDGAEISQKDLRAAMASSRLPSMTNLVVSSEQGEDLIALEAVDGISAYSRGSPLIPVAATAVGLVIDLTLTANLIEASREGRLFAW